MFKFPDSDTVVDKHSRVMQSVSTREQLRNAEKYDQLANRAVVRNDDMRNQPTHSMLMVMWNNWKVTGRRIRGGL